MKNIAISDQYRYFTMTIKINKEVGSTSKIKFKGLGDPGPFSFAIVRGSLPPGTTLDETTGALTGEFNEIGEYDVTIEAVKTERIRGESDFNISVTDWTLHRTDFKTLVDNNNLTWTTSGTVTKILNDPDIFDGECYEVNGRLTINLPEAIGTRDFEIDYIFKPINNGGNDKWGRILMIGPNKTSGMFYFSRNDNLVPLSFILEYVPIGSTSYSRIFTNTTNPLVNNEWNHILIVRKNGVLTYFLNGVREQEASFTHDMNRRELYIGANDTNSEKFHCRVKRLQIRVYDNSHFSTPTLVTDVWRYKLLERSKYFLKSTERNNYLIECNFAGNYTTRVKEGHYLPTGLTLRNNRITGNSDLTDNLTTVIELLINGTVNDEVTIDIINISVPYRLIELPLTGTAGDTVFSDTQSRQWGRRGDVVVVDDTDNFTDLTSTYFDGSGDSLYLTDQSLVLGYDDFSLSFWIKPINKGGGYNSGRIIQCGVNNVNGTFLLSSLNEYGHPNIEFYFYTGNKWVKKANKLIALIDEVFNHIAIARKNNQWRLLVNGILVLEFDQVIDLTGNTIYLANSNTYSEPFRANYFDLKLSKYTVEYWEPFQLPLITRWSTPNLDIVYGLGMRPVNKFKTTWPAIDEVEYLVSDTSALPMGITLNTDGSLSGNFTNLETGTTIVDCYIRGVYNHSTSLNYEVIDNLKDRYLTHSIETKLVDDEFIIETNKSTITVRKVSPVLVGNQPMIDFNLGRGNTNVDSVISIPHNETVLNNSGWFIELDYYISYPGTVRGRGIIFSSDLGDVLFSKSYNSAFGDFILNFTNSKLKLSSNSNVGSHLDRITDTILDTKAGNKYKIALGYDGNRIFFFVNGEKIYEDSWGPMPTVLNQEIQFGTNKVHSFSSHFKHTLGFVNNIKLYQGHFIHNDDYIIEPIVEEIIDYYPVIIPNVYYSAKLIGIVDSTVSITSGSLPNGLTMDNKGTITGITNVAANDYNIELTITKGNIVKVLEVTLHVGKYSIDLDFSKPIVNDTIEDNVGNVFIVNGTPSIVTNHHFNNCMYFNGIDTWLNISAYELYNLGDHDFVIEAEFVLLSDTLANGGSTQGIISQRYNVNSRVSYSLGLESDGSYNTGATDTIPNMEHSKNHITFSSSSTGITDNTVATVFIEINTIYKVRIERIKDLMLLYINDNIRESSKVSKDYKVNESLEDLLIGCIDNQTTEKRLLHGYLNYVKVVTTKDSTKLEQNTGTISKTFSELILELDPIAYYPMDEAGGSIAFDYSANRFNGEYVNGSPVYDGPPLAPGLTGSKGFAINGPDISRMQIPLTTTGENFSKLAYGDNAFTILGWYQRTATTEYNQILSCWINPTGGQCAYRILGRTAFQSPHNANNVSFPDELDEVVFFAWVKDPVTQTYRVFKNGVWYDNGSKYSNNTIVGTHPVQIPATGNWNYYGMRGYVSDFAFFNKALSDKDIEDLYIAGNTPFGTIIEGRGDPYYKHVKALLDFENNYLDATGRPWTLLGTASYSNEQSKFGEYSLSKVNKTGGLRSTSMFNNIDFCIDLWVYLPDSYSGGHCNLLNERQIGIGGAAPGRFEFRITGSKLVIWTVDKDTDIRGVLPIERNKWTHVAFCYRASDRLHKTYVDGKLDINEVGGLINPSADVSLGYFNAADLNERREDIYLDKVRITTGDIRYHGDFFTPPKYESDYLPPTHIPEVDPLADKVKLYLPLDIDSLDHALNTPVNTYGSFNLTTGHPSLYGNSGYFPSRASTSCIQVDQTPDNTIGNKDFCIELWVMPYSHPSSGQWAGYFSNRETSVKNNCLYLESGANNLVLQYSTTGSDNINLFTIDRPLLNVWTHIALTRKGDTFTIYFNGKIKESKTIPSIKLVNQVKGWSLGHSNFPTAGGNYFHGRMADFKLTVDHHRYDGEFTPSFFRDSTFV